MTFDGENIVFGNRLIYPVSDFRLEYRGLLVNGNMMHGQGTLTLKGGKSYSGNWVKGELKKHEVEIMGFKEGWKQVVLQEIEADKKNAAQKKFNKERIYSERATFQRTNDTVAWLDEL